MELFADMDGVLCDFDGACRKHFPDLDDSETISEYKTRVGSNVFWRNIRSTDGVFWSDMEPMDDDIVGVWDCLASACPKIAILSSPDSRDPNCIIGKNQWLDKHLGDRAKTRIFRSDKYAFATPKSILIDDLPKNTVPFQQAGGKAILFQGKFDSVFWNSFYGLVSQ
jgi:hypothetical protein